MMLLRPNSGNIATNDGFEHTLFEHRSHIHADDEQANRQQRSGRMNKNGSGAEKAEIPGNPVGKPKNQAGEKEQEAGPEKTPEEEFLPWVKAIGWGHQVVLVADIVGGLTAFCFRTLRRCDSVPSDAGFILKMYLNGQEESKRQENCRYQTDKGPENPHENPCKDLVFEG